MEQYSIYYDNSCIAVYYRDDEAKEYSYYVGYSSVYKGKVPDKYLRDHEKKTPFRPIEELMTEENRVAGTRKLIYQHDHIRIVRVPRDTEHFAVYNKFARKGSRGYSEERFDAPHYEGEKTPEGMKEWVSYYGFVKKTTEPTRRPSKKTGGGAVVTTMAAPSTLKSRKNTLICLTMNFLKNCLPLQERDITALLPGI